MKVFCLIAFISCVLGAAFQVNTLVMTHGLTDDNLNRRVAVVVEDLSDGRYPVKIWMGLNASPASIKGPVAIKPENLVFYDPDDRDLPKSRAQEQFWTDLKAAYPETWKSVSVDREQEGRYQKYAAKIKALGTPQAILADINLRTECRLMGGALWEEGEIWALKAVIDDYLPRQYSGSVSSVFDRIGNFQA